MEQHAVCAVVLEVVAVYAVVVLLLIGPVVLVDGLLGEVFQASLVYAQLAVQFISGFYQTVGQVRVYCLCHLDGVGKELAPFAILLGIYGYSDFFAHVAFQQISPFGGVHVYAVCAGSGKRNAVSFQACNHALGTINHEIKRCNVFWYHNVLIVGVDAGLLCLFNVGCWNVKCLSCKDV